MGPSVAVRFLQDLFLIVDLTHRRDGKAAQMGLQKQRLRLIIRNAADPQISFQFLHIPFKLGTERRILYIMDRAVKPVFTVNSHSASSRAEMRMVVHAVEKLQHTILFRCNAKKSTHL